MNLIDVSLLSGFGSHNSYYIVVIEKKPLNHFLPGTPVLSFGTAGCNLACKFCQNWDISKSREIDTLADAAAPDKIARVAAELNCRSVAFTYNDPIIFLEYAIDTSIACHELGIKTVAVSSEWKLDDRGCCRNCGTACAGRFESEPGTWGSRFQPVYMSGYAA